MPRLFRVSASSPLLSTGKLTEFLDYFEPKIDEYNDLLSFNHIFVKRTADVGVVTKEQCIRYALSGPMIRGSGIPLDLRKDRPYSIYDRFDFDVCVGTGEKGALGDCWDFACGATSACAGASTSRFSV